MADTPNTPTESTQEPEKQKKQTPLLPPIRQSTGQRSSKERGAHTRSKKNPGKRPKQGGN